MSVAPSKPLGDLLHELQQPQNLTLAYLQQLWRAPDREQWGSDPEMFILLGQKILKLGEPLLAYDVLDEGAEVFPENVRLRQLLSLALARSGATERANAVLLGLYRDGNRDEETVGMLARTYKDLGEFERAFDLYSAAHKLSGGYYSGINAATLALMLGRREEAEALARQVVRECQLLDVSNPDNHDRYWIFSTLGEASLVLHERQEAEDWYGKAMEIANGDWGNVQSTARNARLLLQNLGESSAEIERILKVPSVVVFSGHMVDRPGRVVPRFPPEIEAQVRQALRDRLRELNVGFGFASAACGGDILFHETLAEMKVESHVILPHDRHLFIKESVENLAGTDWLGRFENVLAQAVEVHETSDQARANPALYDFANRMLHGLAAVRAQQLETRLAALAVWDGNPGDGPGGTAGAVNQWRESGLDVQVIDPTAFLNVKSPPVKVTSGTAPDVGKMAPSAFVSEVRALLFADVEGFSKLTDEELPLFVEHFLGAVASLMKYSRSKPLLENTWGDGLYFVFSSVGDAGQFALDLLDVVRAEDWTAKGLPRLNLRVGLHAGPVYRCEDPVTKRPNYIGAHVSRAARIEPITPSGYVYASQPFAALAAAEGVKTFRCNYVGQTAMAKEYGTFPTYVVLRA